MKISQNLVVIENQGRDKKLYWGQEKNVATRDRMRRQKKKLQGMILSQHLCVCHDTKRRQLLSQQKNDVVTRNDSFIN